ELRRTPFGWEISLASCPLTTPALTARFLVDATGGRASIARHLGSARLSPRDDHLLCAAMYYARPGYTTQAPGPTLLEAVADGWWYSATLPRDRLVVTFMTDADRCALLRRVCSDWFTK